MRHVAQTYHSLSIEANHRYLLELTRLKRKLNRVPAIDKDGRACQALSAKCQRKIVDIVGAWPLISQPELRRPAAIMRNRIVPEGDI